MTTTTALITGASRGIGYILAKELAVRGATVIATMRDPNGRNSAIAQELTGWANQEDLSLQVLDLDVCDQTSVDKAVQSVESEGQIDALINNAGIMPTGLTEAFTLEQAQQTFDVNVYGIMRTCRAVLPFMRKRKAGRIISISSAAGRLAIPYFGLYCASKWAMEAYCETLHYELEPFGIDSVLVEPSGHATDLVASAPAPQDLACLSQYGELSKGREKLLGMFHDMFAQGESITDAANVARMTADLVFSTSPLPLRTQVGADMGVTAFNEAVAPVQSALVDSLKPVYAAT